MSDEEDPNYEEMYNDILEILLEIDDDEEDGGEEE